MFGRATITLGIGPHSSLKPECGSMPNVMPAQPNIGGALCESSVIPLRVPRRSLTDARCWNAVQ